MGNSGWKPLPGLKEEMQLQMALWASAEACAAEAAAASASLVPWKPRLFGDGKKLTQPYLFGPQKPMEKMKVLHFYTPNIWVIIIIAMENNGKSNIAMAGIMDP